MDASYWQQQWMEGQTGWDLGHLSRPLKWLIDQVDDKDLRILVPGAGNGYEVAYLYNQGFVHTFMLDWASAPLESFINKYKYFPKDQLLCRDFFDLKGRFDLIFEQTFFCALQPEYRPQYVKKMQSLLSKDGVLTGVLFNKPLFSDRPPFGGDEEQYRALFSEHFDIERLEPCVISEPDRQGSELIFRLRVLQEPLNDTQSD